MANPEHVEILKQGVEVWNKWMKQSVEISIGINDYSCSLSQADLRGLDLQGVDFRRADLRGAWLNGCNLAHSNLHTSVLVGAVLGDFTTGIKAVGNAAYQEDHGLYEEGEGIKSEQDVMDKYVSPSLETTDLHRFRVGLAFDEYQGFKRTDLSFANLENADLRRTALVNTTLKRANLSNASFGSTVVDCDLSETIGLETIDHFGSTRLSQKSLSLMANNFSDNFLKGCGLTDWEIEQTKLYQPDLSNKEINDIIYRIYDLRATQSIQIAPMFISYSHDDKAFVDKIGEMLTKKGVRYWRDIHNMKAGNMEKQVDRAMRLNDLVLIVLSENSVKSDWVELEVNKARKLEKEHDKDVLCPIALDDSWKDVKWSESIQLQLRKYNILDFSDWQNEEVLKKKFADLITGIDLFYE